MRASYFNLRCQNHEKCWKKPDVNKSGNIFLLLLLVFSEMFMGDAKLQTVMWKSDCTFWPLGFSLQHCSFSFSSSSFSFWANHFWFETPLLVFQLLVRNKYNSSTFQSPNLYSSNLLRQKSTLQYLQYRRKRNLQLAQEDDSHRMLLKEIIVVISRNWNTVKSLLRAALE